MAKWILSNDHSAALFATRHMMVTWVRGFFTEVRGTLVFDPLDVAAATLSVEIAAASLYTGVARRDDHLKSADFLDVAHYPAITFTSTGVEQVALDQAWVKGDLTIAASPSPCCWTPAGQAPPASTTKARSTPPSVSGAPP